MQSWSNDRNSSLILSPYFHQGAKIIQMSAAQQVTKVSCFLVYFKPAWLCKSSVQEQAAGEKTTNLLCNLTMTIIMHCVSRVWLLRCVMVRRCQTTIMQQSGNRSLQHPAMFVCSLITEPVALYLYHIHRQVAPKYVSDFICLKCISDAAVWR